MSGKLRSEITRTTCGLCGGKLREGGCLKIYQWCPACEDAGMTVSGRTDDVIAYGRWRPSSCDDVTWVDAESGITHGPWWPRYLDDLAK